MPRFIYKNKTTGQTTIDKEVANRWFDEGANIGIWSYSDFLSEWIEFMERIH